MYIRPRRKAKTLNAPKNTSKNNYHQLFNPARNQTNVMLLLNETIDKLNQSIHFIHFPMQIYINDITKKYTLRNPDFLHQLSIVISKKLYLSIGFVIIIHKTFHNKKHDYSHMLSGILQTEHIDLDVYDPLGDTEECKMVQHYIEEIHPLRQFNSALNNKNKIPTSVCKINDNGVCSLWSIIFLINRLLGATKTVSVNRVHNISKNNKVGKHILTSIMDKFKQMLMLKKIGGYNNDIVNIFNETIAIIQSAN